MPDKTVAIALATFNGECFIEEQIKSIQASHFEGWDLIIRDDCSLDNTISIIKKLQEDDPRIILLETGEAKNLGYCKNFNAILTYIFEHEYNTFLLSDQDDYWFPNKLSIQLEKLCNHPYPHLIHSDLEIVDHNLKIVNPSYFKHHKYDSVAGQSLSYLLMENHIPGCTILGNRQLLKLALPFPETLHNHDWWLTVVASSTGKIDYIDEALIKYRQHATNLIGGQSFITAVTNPRKNIFNTLNKHISQFKDQLIVLSTLATRLKASSINPNSLLLVEDFIKICTSNETVCKKLFHLYKNGFRTHHFLIWVIVTNNLININATHKRI